MLCSCIFVTGDTWSALEQKRAGSCHRVVQTRKFGLRLGHLGPSMCQMSCELVMSDESHVSRCGINRLLDIVAFRNLELLF